MKNHAENETARAPEFSPAGGALLGFSLGGFFDGILLHQILQWHHLLSNVTKVATDLRTQILADGLFHLLMYLTAVVGLWRLFKARHMLAMPQAGRRLLSAALIGFGAWHVVDGVLSHWVLGIHRIRVDSSNPLFWDLLWFVVFGLGFLAAGWKLRSASPPTDGGAASGLTAKGRPTALGLVLAASLAGPFAALPPANQPTVMVFFRPDTPPLEIFRAIEAADARILWASADGSAWALHTGERRDLPALYRHGAWLVSGSALALGCLAWISVRS